MTDHRQQRVALILAGAVAKGAFEAGVLAELARGPFRVERIVGTSAGAMNGVAYAAAIRAGREQQAAEELVQVWRDDVRVESVFDLSVSGVLHGRGLSRVDKLLDLLCENVKPADIPEPQRRQIDLRIVVAPLAGVPAQMAGVNARAYEKVLEFRDRDFDDEARLRAVFDAAIASAAFPFAFVPKELPGVGACVDGGLVNNTPIAHALRDSDIKRVLVVVPAPLSGPRQPAGGGLSLVSHLAEILLDERFVRDVSRADEVNHALAKLHALADQGALSHDQLGAVLAALSWKRRRVIDLVQIRPEVPLAGNAFSGFSDKSLRLDYIEQGRAAARAALARLRD